LLLTLLIFGGFAFVLAAVLNVTTLQALLHAQIPQIGTLKTLGASGRRIAALYALKLGVLGALGAGVGVPLGLLLGRSYADFTGGFLNLRMSSLALEASWLFGLVTVSLLLPVVLALPAVLRATRRTVRECLAASAPSRDAGIAAQLPTGLSGRPLLAYALRNALRRPGRMALSLATLVVANVVLFTAANVGRAWLELLDEADRRQPHSAILRVAPSPAAAASAAAALAEAPAFDAEVWRSYVARSEQRPGESFQVHELREPTSMIDLDLLGGRWLATDDTEGIAVLDHVLAQKLSVDVGARVPLLARAEGGDERDEMEAALTVVGIAEDVGSLGGAYVRRAPSVWQPRSLRVVLAGASAPTRAAQQKLADAARERLEAADLSVAGSRTSSTRNKGLFDHVVLFRRTLALMAALLGVVGGLGLLSAIGLNVLERRGELGVLRAVGAGGRTLVRVLLVEGLVLGAAAVFVAALLSLPLSFWAGSRTGETFVLVPLPFAWAPWAYGAGLLGTLALAALASWWPARSLARRTVRRALRFV
ncbi:MAG: FtsX-like permease family protein, partial [Acidobacteriota bacterium]